MSCPCLRSVLVLSVIVARGPPLFRRCSVSVPSVFRQCSIGVPSVSRQGSIRVPSGFRQCSSVFRRYDIGVPSVFRADGGVAAMLMCPMSCCRIFSLNSAISGVALVESTRIVLWLSTLSNMSLLESCLLPVRWTSLILCISVCCISVDACLWAHTMKWQRRRCEITSRG